MEKIDHNEARQRLIKCGVLDNVETLLLDIRNFLKNPKYKSLLIRNCKFQQSVLMDNTRIGQLYLENVDIGGDFSLANALITGDLSMFNVRVGGIFYLLLNCSPRSVTVSPDMVWQIHCAMPTTPIMIMSKKWSKK